MTQRPCRRSRETTIGIKRTLQFFAPGICIFVHIIQKFQRPRRIPLFVNYCRILNASPYIALQLTMDAGWSNDVEYFRRIF
ncbi:hypothetical protein KM043_017151 [Ampulex compressa]|nr:hypothetical protein KM043_017151 [Ampulex compressa]